jgi:hypothetical protein
VLAEWGGECLSRGSKKDEGWSAAKSGMVHLGGSRGKHASGKGETRGHLARRAHRVAAKKRTSRVVSQCASIYGLSEATMGSSARAAAQEGLDVRSAALILYLRHMADSRRVCTRTRKGLSSG